MITVELLAAARSIWIACAYYYNTHGTICVLLLFHAVLPCLGLASRGSEEDESIRRAAYTPYYVRAAANTLAQKVERHWDSSADGEQQHPERIPAAEPGWEADGARWPFGYEYSRSLGGGIDSTGNRRALDLQRPACRQEVSVRQGRYAIMERWSWGRDWCFACVLDSAIFACAIRDCVNIRVQEL